MSFAISPSMKEDLKREEEWYDIGPLAISSSMKEDLKEEEEERLKDGSTIVGSACFEDM